MLILCRQAVKPCRSRPKSGRSRLQRCEKYSKQQNLKGKSPCTCSLYVRGPIHRVGKLTDGIGFIRHLEQYQLKYLLRLKAQTSSNQQAYGLKAQQTPSSQAYGLKALQAPSLGQRPRSKKHIPSYALKRAKAFSSGQRPGP